MIMVIVTMIFRIAINVIIANRIPNVNNCIRYQTCTSNSDTGNYVEAFISGFVSLSWPLGRYVPLPVVSLISEATCFFAGVRPNSQIRGPY